jgi:2'-5' RNA ligase
MPTAFANAISERDRRREMREYREMYPLDMGADTQGADQVEATPSPRPLLVCVPPWDVRECSRVCASAWHERKISPVREDFTAHVTVYRVRSRRDDGDPRFVATHGVTAERER